MKYKLYTAPEFFEAYEKGFLEGRKHERRVLRLEFDQWTREFKKKWFIEDLEKERDNNP